MAKNRIRTTMRTVAARMVLILLVVSLSPGISYAVRPFRQTDTATPINRGNSKLEYGVIMGRTADNKKFKKSLAELTFGIINNLDFELEVPYYTTKVNNDTISGIGDVTMKGKLTFLKAREANRLALAGMITAKFPSCNEDKKLAIECTGEPDQGIKFIASRLFFPDKIMPLTLHFNFGRVFLGNPPDARLKDITAFSIAAETSMKQIKAITLVGEISGSTNSEPGATEDLQYLLIGLRTRVSKRFQLDASFSAGSTISSDNFGFDVGFTYDF